jgi:hypothetical protein
MHKIQKNISLKTPYTLLLLYSNIISNLDFLHKYNIIYVKLYTYSPPKRNE